MIKHSAFFPIVSKQYSCHFVFSVLMSQLWVRRSVRCLILVCWLVECCVLAIKREARMPALYVITVLLQYKKSTWCQTSFNQFNFLLWMWSWVSLSERFRQSIGVLWRGAWAGVLGSRLWAARLSRGLCQSVWVPLLDQRRHGRKSLKFLSVFQLVSNPYTFSPMCHPVWFWDFSAVLGVFFSSHSLIRKNRELEWLMR